MPNHRQVLVELDNGDETYIAYCKKHNPNEREMKKITRLTLDFIASQRDTTGQLKNKLKRINYKRRK